MPRVGLTPKIPAFEWAKTVHALDPAATVIGNNVLLILSIYLMKNNVNVWITVEEFLLVRLIL
jgi:hypothetical protein